MSKPISSYQQYLPAPLQEDAIVGGFLQAFEQILASNISTDKLANDSTNPLGLEEIINQIHLYFNPRQTPEEFLPWLAGWVALSIRDDWRVEVKREFIQQIVKLYRLRGTKDGLTQVLQLYLTNSGFGDNVKIFDRFEHFPDYFQVQLTLNDRDPEKYWRQVKIAKAIIDQEKPAHTFYTLKILVPTMQMTKRSLASYPFTLFYSPLVTPDTQEFTIEIAITLNQISADKIPAIAKKIGFQIQGDLVQITPYSPTLTTNNQTISVKQKITYQQFLDNLSKFNISLSNSTDNPLVGNVAVNLYFNLNGTECSYQILSKDINLLPILKICRTDATRKLIEGSTVIKQAKLPERSGMQITQMIWTDPYRFSLFDLPMEQTLELEASVRINKPQKTTSDLTNKITVRLQNDSSKFYLLTPNATISSNKIKITRTLDYRQFLQSLDGLKLVVKNLNSVAISGKVSVQVTMNINQRSTSFQLFQEDFNLAAVPLKNILQICCKDEKGNVVTNVEEPILTIIGTT